MDERRRLGIALLAVVLYAVFAPTATGKGLINSSPAPAGVALDGSPYRFLTISPAVPKPLTVVERVDRRGGRVSRWWHLPGRFFVMAPAYDLVGAGLSADERILVLRRIHQSVPERRTLLAILDTGAHLRHPAQYRRRAISYVGLKGDYGVHAISPDGATVYLTHLVSGPPGVTRFTIRALDTASGQLLPRFSIPGNGEILTGLPVTREPDPGGRTVYTLYYDSESRRASLLALATVTPSLRAIELPQLRGRRDPMLLRLRLSDSGQRLTVSTLSREDRDSGLQPLLRIDTRTLAVRRLPPRARRLEPRFVRSGGGPDPRADLLFVRNLDPDGLAKGTRLNGRGVDLNRNFPASWRPIGRRGDPEFSGPRPFSEPETRLAARIVREVEPEATVWFHQHRGEGAYVRAWGRSAPLARRFARLARVRFRLLPWLAGTAPNWQNHRFPGTASFVVELPAGELDEGLGGRLGAAIVLLGREVGED